MRVGWGRFIRRAGFGLAAVALAALVAQAPRALRRFHTFDVTTVVVRGAGYIAPHEALEASGVTVRTSVFDDFAPIRARLVAHPLIESARVERRLPRTLVFTLRETEPVALAQARMLVPVDRRGRVLPIDPANAPLDLPVIVNATSAEVEPEPGEPLPGAVRLAGELARLRRMQPELASRISAVSTLPDGGVRLVLREPAGAVALLSDGAGALRLRELMLALRHLDRRSELTRLRRIDARFDEQIVVTLKPVAS